MAKFSGKNLTVEIYGESHAEKIGVKVTGFPEFNFSTEKLNQFLSRRKPNNSAYSTARKEDDIPVFSFNGNKTKKQFTAEIFNKNVKSKDYNNLYGKPRPSHADYSAYLKDGTLDYSGGGRFSGRLTAPLCIVGGLLKQYLEEKGIYVFGYLSSVGKVDGKSYKTDDISLEQLKNLNTPFLSCQDEMLKEIENAKREGDSVGGVVEIVVFNYNKGIGDNLFSGLEGKISSLIFSVPAVKGVEFGQGFSLTKLNGSTANDQLYYENDKVKFKTNNSGGINGGISNGENITIRVAVKPTPSIYKEQDTVDLVNKKNTKILIEGRHDSCIAVRAVPAIESAVIIALVDEMEGIL